MEALDLQRHRPDEFIDKIVSINGCDYRIGRSFRVGDQGYAHFLVNEASGLCLHIIQIRPEYLSSPKTARGASKAKESFTAAMRAGLMKKSEPMIVPLITVTEANGGFFELHEMSWGSFQESEELIGNAAIGKANAYEKAKHFDLAIVELKNLLSDSPNHTIALNNLASNYYANNDLPSAIAAIERAIAIEPNYSLFLGNQIMYAIVSPHRRQGLNLFRTFKARFPHCGDYDMYGVQVCRICGEIDEAVELLKRAALPKAQNDELSALLTPGIPAKAQFLALDKAIREGEPISSRTLADLIKINNSYPDDPMVKANLGFMLFRDGQYQRAFEFLISAMGATPDSWYIYCLANAAFCQIKLGKWSTALPLLHGIMVELNLSIKEVQYQDVPGVVKWIHADDVIQEAVLPSAAEILDSAIKQCQNREYITTEVLQLASLYRQAAKEYMGHTADMTDFVGEEADSEKHKSWWRRFRKH